MSDKERTSDQSKFIKGFTGKSLEIKRKKGKRPMTEREAAEKRKARNAKYDQYGNIR
jgi:hypothetical protein